MGTDLPPEQKERHMQQLLYTKFSHWKYEKEVRIFVDLRGAQIIDGRKFYPFSDFGSLKEVIVGAESDITRERLAEALGSHLNSVVVKRGRLAYKSFRIVENRSSGSW